MNLEVICAEIILRFQFGENFLDVRCLGVASRLRELDDWLLIVKGLHRVLFQSEILLSVFIVHLDTERCGAINRNTAKRHLLASGLQRYRLPVGKYKPTA